ncbi:MAG: ATP-binding protein [Rubrivivax sp.]|nr:ATP-binding protein [Rubrivivax sp.]
MNAAAEPPWSEANQRLLAAEFAALRALLGETTGERPDLAEARAALPEPAAIDELAALFGLSPFERQVLLLVAGVEMDSAMARLLPRPSFSAALATLPGAHWSAIGPLAPLRAWRLVELDEPSPTQARLRIDERILHHLAGVNRIDARLAPLLRLLPQASLMAPSHQAELERLLGLPPALSDSGPTLWQLSGSDSAAQRAVAAAVAHEQCRVPLLLAAQDIPAGASEQEALAVLWQREAALLPALLVVEGAERAGSDGAAARFIARLHGLVLLVGREAGGFAVQASARLDLPGPAEQGWLWRHALGDAPAALHASAAALAQQVRLGAPQIDQQATLACALAAQEGDQPAAAQLWRGVTQAVRPALDGLARRIEPQATWQSLVLPEPVMASLRLIAAQVGQRRRVYEEWGFGAQGGGERGLGISALFCGESGVGKTLACEVLAHELGLELLRVDLAGVVSKYIGETEKNLQRVFDAAEASGALLLFDEADALFGKRSEVKDSHDRYANIEVSYLLQRMEAYAGLSVLTTNQRGSIDPAFLRRLRFVLAFPFPDEAQREALWRQQLPAAMPRQGIATAQLAKLRLTGGQIRNIALNAAFLAADDGGRPVTMAHLAHAAQLEAAKHERSDLQTRGWVA